MSSSLDLVPAPSNPSCHSKEGTRLAWFVLHAGHPHHVGRANLVTPYILFSAAKRTTMMEENPEKQFSEADPLLQETLELRVPVTPRNSVCVWCRPTCWTCCPTLSLGECSDEMLPRRRSRSELGTQVRTCVFGLLSVFFFFKNKNRQIANADQQKLYFVRIFPTP